MRTLHDAARALAEGRTTSRALVEECLARIADPAGEGARAFIKVYADPARAMADAADALRRVGRAPGPLAGIPVSIKDLFDVAGEPTPAGSVVLADAPPAAAHAPVIAAPAGGRADPGRPHQHDRVRLLRPRHQPALRHAARARGTGRQPHSRRRRRPARRYRCADGMAFAALGTDTGGSCRMPAAMCGIVGYKPTARRVPIAGVLPLAPSLDSVGPLANSVACCAAIDAVLAGEAPPTLRPAALAGLRLAVPQNCVLDGLDAGRRRGVRAGAGTAVGRGRAHRHHARSRRWTTSRPPTRAAASRRPRPMPGIAGCWPTRAPATTRGCAGASSAAHSRAPPTISTWSPRARRSSGA